MPPCGTSGIGRRTIQDELWGQFALAVSYRSNDPGLFGLREAQLVPRWVMELGVYSVWNFRGFHDEFHAALL